MATARLFKVLGVIPVLAVVAVITTLRILDIRTVFKLPLAVTIGYFFIVAVASVVAYISGKGYLQTGSLILLLLGCGTLTFGVAALLTGLVVVFAGAGNATATIMNTGLLLASVLNFQCAFLASVGIPSKEAKGGRMTLVSSYLGVLVFMALLTMATLQGATPPFYIPGAGSTLLLQWVIGIAVAMFVISFIIFMRICSRSKAELLYWYALALVLIASGSFAHFLLMTTDIPIQWTGRFAYYLAGIYLLIAVLTTIRGARHRYLCRPRREFGEM